MADDEIKIIRQVRHEISAECGHDVDRVVDYYRSVEEELRQSGRYRFAARAAGPEQPDAETGLGRNRLGATIAVGGRDSRRSGMTIQTLDQHIECTEGIAGGKPRIAGHRITVQNIAIWHDRLGMSADEIASEYDLTLADVHAALAYYFDHRVEIDRSIEAGEAFAEALRQQLPSKVRQRLTERHGDGDAN